MSKLVRYFLLLIFLCSLCLILNIKKFNSGYLLNSRFGLLRIDSRIDSFFKQINFNQTFIFYARNKEILSDDGYDSWNIPKDFGNQFVIACKKMEVGEIHLILIDINKRIISTQQSKQKVNELLPRILLSCLFNSKDLTDEQIQLFLAIANENTEIMTIK